MTQPARRRGGAFSSAFGSALSEQAKAEAPEGKAAGKADEEKSIGKAVEEAAKADEGKKANGKAADGARKEKTGEKGAEEAGEKKAAGGALKEPAPARSERTKADQSEEAEDQERPLEAQHGFAGAIFGTLLKDVGDREVKHMLDKLGKAVPPPPPNAAYSVGQRAEVIGTIMRMGESLDSPKLCRLEPGTEIEIVEIGKGPTGKRIQVLVLNGLAARGMRGWISVVSGEGAELLTPAGGSGASGGFIGDLIGSLAVEEDDLPAKKSNAPGGGGGDAVGSAESIDAVLGRIDLDARAAAGEQEEAPPPAQAKPPRSRRSAFGQFAQ